MRPTALCCLALAAPALAQPVHAASALWTADDPFVGKWSLNVARSTIVDHMRIKALGSNRFAFNFEGGPTETVVADGTDQPGLPGTTLVVKALDARNLTVVRKQDGRVVVSAVWRLMPDSRTLLDHFTNVQSDGSRLTTKYVYRRLSGTSGFTGAWESTTPPAGLKLELRIEPYESKGLTFVSPGSNKNVVFDTREHAGAASGLTYSARRGGVRSMQYTEKNHGRVERVRRFKLSSDGRTLTEIIHIAGQASPDVFVFERE